MAHARPGRHEILLISNDASATGAPQSLLTFVRWLVSTGVASPRVVLAARGPLESEFAQLCPIYRVWRGAGDFTGRVLGSLERASWKLHRFASMAALSRAQAQWRTSLLYANSIATARETATLRRSGIPIIMHIRELDTVFASIDGSDLTTALGVTDQFIANSEATKSNLVARGDIAPERIEVVYPFIDCSIAGSARHAGRAAELRRELGVTAGQKLLIGCGTIHRRKGTDLFIQVAAAVASQRVADNVKLVWVGGDTSDLTREQMRQRAAEHGLSNVVRFVGHRSDYLDYLGAADVLLLTSREEPFGRVILEAALFGRPTICFGDCGGAPEFVRHDAGRVVGRERVDEMAAAAIELLDSDELRASLGARARQRVLEQHSVEAGASRIWSIVERTLTKKESFPQRNVTNRNA